jgi:dTMP kinase
MNSESGQRRGVLIAIEGGDGSGKSTQARRATEYVRAKGREVLLVREPGGTRVGERVREILLDPDLQEMGVRAELFLYMAARAQLVEEVIRPALGRGEVVIADRFLLSSVVYQGVAGGIGASLVREMGSLAVRGVEPDLTLVLDVDREEAEGRSRGEKDRMEGKPTDFHDRVRRGYVDAAAAPGGRIRLVPASGAVEEVESIVREEIDRVLG